MLFIFECVEMDFWEKTLVVMTVITLCVCKIECGALPNPSNTNNYTEEAKGLSEVAEGRGGEEKKEDMMSKILPMMVMPFMVQTTMLPMMLVSMKFMLIQSMVLGKFAILLALVTFLRNLLKKNDGFYSHNINLQPHHGRGFDFGYDEKTR